MATSVAPARWQVPPLVGNDRLLGGVASALAREVGVPAGVVRAAFVVLTMVGGWGLVLYALAWAGLAIAGPGTAVSYRPHPKGATPTHRLVAVAMITLGLMAALAPLSTAATSRLTWPVGFVLSGMLIAWTRSDEGGTSVLVRVVAGLVVAIGGFLAFTATQVDLSDALVALVFALAILAGVAVVAAPSILRMGRALDRERQQRIRSDERARINAHLHDSVLQTLTLIQQQGGDPVRTRQLARRQERELRSWLHGTVPDTPTGVRLGPALEHAASAVEGRFDVTIAVVAVGDNDDLAPADLDALVAAAAEAMTNAAKHAGVAQVDVYGERRDGGMEVFVRDTGCGFDTSSVGDDRHGLAGSIVARMHRAGGRATISSTVGGGTEVELWMPAASHPADPVQP